MARMTESQLRSIVKQELKKILNEIGSSDYMDEPDAPRENPKRDYDKAKDEQAYIQSLKSAREIINSLTPDKQNQAYRFNTTDEYNDFLYQNPLIPYEEVPAKFLNHYKNLIGLA